MDVERRLIIMRRVMGAVGTVILEIAESLGYTMATYCNCVRMEWISMRRILE